MNKMTSPLYADYGITRIACPLAITSGTVPSAYNEFPLVYSPALDFQVVHEHLLSTTIPLAALPTYQSIRKFHKKVVSIVECMPGDVQVAIACDQIILCFGTVIDGEHQAKLAPNHND